MSLTNLEALRVIADHYDCSYHMARHILWNLRDRETLTAEAFEDEETLISTLETIENTGEI